MSKNPIDAFHTRVAEASLAGDVDLIVSDFADDAVMMPPNDTTLFGKDEVKAWWQEYFQFFTITSSVVTDQEVTSADGLLFSRVGFTATIVPKQGGSTIRDEIRSLTVWKRQSDSSWKISQQIWNSVKPVGAGTTRFMTRLIQKKTQARKISVSPNPRKLGGA